MAEVALIISIVALVVAIGALGIASSAARTSLGPRPNVLSPLGEFPEAAGPGSASAQVMALLARGDKIGAIKQFRIETGAGLKEAKDAVEALEAGRR